jgi:ATP/maltotriose-dependent transcriptional regulator MalT
MREAIRLATQAGQGREAAVMYGNLGETLSGFEGPTAGLQVMREGITFALARGITEIVDFITPSTLDPLFARGELDEAFEVAAGLAAALEGTEVLTFAITRAAQARISALRGQAADIAESLDGLEATVRAAEAPEYLVMGLASSAVARAVLRQDNEAAALLTELATATNARHNMYYAAYLPTLVRTAVAVGRDDLAQRLTADYHARTPDAQHALVTATATLAEARGDHQTAAGGYADAAQRWEQFGVLPEQAYALQGHGRCLINLGQPGHATPVLRRARELFDQLGARPAVAETDVLLQQAVALSS